MGRGLSAPPSVPLNPGIVSGHLLCAADEFPIVGRNAAISLLSCTETFESIELLSDFDLFGSESVYKEALENLSDRGAIKEDESIQILNVEAFIKHPVRIYMNDLILFVMSSWRAYFVINFFNNVLNSL